MYYDTHQQQRTENTNKTVSFSTSVQVKRLSDQGTSHYDLFLGLSVTLGQFILLLKTDLFGFFNGFR